MITQAAALRDEFLGLAARLEGEPKTETPGTICLKGIAETLNDLIYNPYRLDEARLTTWVQQLRAQPEFASVRPWALLGTQSIKVPLAQMALWRATVASAVNFAVYSSLTSLGLAIAGDGSSSVYGLSTLFLALCVTLRATVRLIS